MSDEKTKGRTVQAKFFFRRTRTEATSGGATSAHLAEKTRNSCEFSLKFSSFFSFFSLLLPLFPSLLSLSPPAQIRKISSFARLPPLFFSVIFIFLANPVRCGSHSGRGDRIFHRTGLVGGLFSCDVIVPHWPRRRGNAGGRKAAAGTKGGVRVRIMAASAHRLFLFDFVYFWFVLRRSSRGRGRSKSRMERWTLESRRYQ